MATLTRRRQTAKCHPCLYPAAAVPLSISKTNMVMSHRYGYRPARSRSTSPNIAIITSSNGRDWGKGERIFGHMADLNVAVRARFAMKCGLAHHEEFVALASVSGSGTVNG